MIDMSWFEICYLVLLTAVVIGGIYYTVQESEAFDILPTVDPATDSRTLLSGTPNIYRFGQPVTMKNVTYSDGSVVPTATMSIEQFNQTSQKWEIIGYSNTHLHKLKVDATDKVDVSIGHTDRINIKQKAPTTIPPVVD